MPSFRHRHHHHQPDTIRHCTPQPTCIARFIIAKLSAPCSSKDSPPAAAADADARPPPLLLPPLLPLLALGAPCSAHMYPCGVAERALPKSPICSGRRPAVSCHLLVTLTGTVGLPAKGDRAETKKKGPTLIARSPFSHTMKTFCSAARMGQRGWPVRGWRFLGGGRGDHIASHRPIHPHVHTFTHL